MRRDGDCKQRPGRLSQKGTIGYIWAMSFTFRRLEIFVEAARDGNFRKTADRIGISQPAISKQIHALERDLGKTLFLRTRGSPARLSEEGEALLAHAGEMLSQRKSFGGGRNEPLVLRVLTGDYLLDNIIKPNLSAFHMRFPEVMIEFRIGNDPELRTNLLRSGEVDLAIYTGRPPAADDGDSEIVATVHCGLFAAPALADRVGGDPAAISAAPFIIPTAKRTSSWVTMTLEKAGIFPSNIIARSPFGDVLAQMAREGRGIAILFDEHVRARFGDAIRRLPIEIDPAYRVMVRGKRARMPELQPCIDYLRALVDPGAPGR